MFDSPPPLWQQKGITPFPFGKHVWRNGVKLTSANSHKLENKRSFPSQAALLELSQESNVNAHRSYLRVKPTTLMGKYLNFF